MSRLFLVRHGESAWNAERRLQGQAQAPLSGLGRRQAGALRTTLEQLPVEQVVASDLDRARDTAELAGFPGPPTDVRWRERGLGVWEDQLEDEISKTDMAALRTGDLVPEGAEAWPDFQARVAEAAEELAQRGGDWIVFTHGGCVRSAIAHVTGADWRTVSGPANTSVSVVRVGKRPRVLAFNWTPDLPGLKRASDPGA